MRRRSTFTTAENSCTKLRQALRCASHCSAVTAALFILACSSPEPFRAEGSLNFEPERPRLVQGTEPATYTGDNSVVLEALEMHRTGLDLHRNVIIRTCGPNQGVCHNQKEYPDLHTPSNLLNAIDAPCNVQPGDWSAVYDGCEQPGDRFQLSSEGRKVEIAYVEYIPGDAQSFSRDRPPTAESAGLHIHLAAPIDDDDRRERWGDGRFSRKFITNDGQVEEIVYARYRTQWWYLGDRSHLFGTVANYQVNSINELLAVGIEQGDMNRNGVFGAREAKPLSLLSAGSPESSYLIGRLRGELDGTKIPGTRMPLANQPLSLTDMLALYCFVEGLPAGLDGVYDLATPIDYAGCRWSENPEALNLLGQGVTWLGRVQPLLRAHCGGCHNETAPQAGFDVMSDGVYERLLEASSQNDSLPLVTPGEPSQSYLWLKLTAADEIVGLGMPLDSQGAPAPLSDGALQDIETWIRNGAAAEE